MKAILVILLMLLLCGCTADPEETTTPTPAATAPTAPGLYEPASALEQQTGGAIASYGSVTGKDAKLLAMGQDLLLFTYEENCTVVTRLSGKNAHPNHTARLEGRLIYENGAIAVDKNVLLYYSEVENSIVFLDSRLQRTKSLALPADITAAPVISANLKRAYYCQGQQVRYLDLEAGVAGLLRNQETDALVPIGLAASDSVLVCWQGGEMLTYISTDDGRTLATSDPLELDCYQSDYFLALTGADQLEYLFGKVDGEPKTFLCSADVQCVPLLNKMLVLCWELADDGLRGDVYNLNSGLRIASQVTEGITEAHSPVVDDESGIWFLGATGENTILCRWDINLSSLQDPVCYTGIRYTPDFPDTEGLAQCNERLQALSDTYGLDLHLWDNGYAPDGYTFSAIYNARTLTDTLDALENTLALFPKGFFAQLEDGKMKTELVLNIKTDSELVDPEQGSLAYWLNGEGYLALSCGEDTQRSFCSALSNILDTHIYANSLKYDDWDALNPSGFVYDGSYAIYAQRTDMKWLEDQNRAFVDSYAMTFEREDRARIFALALEEGNEEVFSSPTMQKKLKCLCDAIRDAFDWEDVADSFAWEQYLKAE